MSQDLMRADIQIHSAYSAAPLSFPVGRQGRRDRRHCIRCWLQERHDERAAFSRAFSRHPIMPGVTIVEAMAQTAGCYGRRRVGSAGQGDADLFHVHRQMQIPPQSRAG